MNVYPAVTPGVAGGAVAFATLRKGLLAAPIAVAGSLTALAGAASAATLPVQTKPALALELSVEGSVDPVAHRPSHNVKPAQKARSRQHVRSGQKVRSTRTARSSQRVGTSQRALRWDRRHHGSRYRHKRHGYHHFHGGYWYRTPWWTAAIVAPVLPIYGGGGDAHVQWCLNNYRSYDPQTDQFLGYGGVYHYCNSPFR